MSTVGVYIALGQCSKRVDNYILVSIVKRDTENDSNLYIGKRALKSYLRFQINS